MPCIQLTGCMSSVVSAVEVHALFTSASLDVPITRMPTFGILFELLLFLYARQVSSESSPSLWFTFSWILPPDIHRHTHIHSDTYTTDIIGVHASFNKAPGRPRLPQTHCFWHTTETARRERDPFQCAFALMLFQNEEWLSLLEMLQNLSNCSE